MNDIIAELRAAAQQFDLYLSDPVRLKVHARYGDAKRDAANPPYMEMDTAAQAKAVQHGWYISPADLIATGPETFTALDGTIIHKTADGYINPYGPTGFAGPGILGHGIDSKGNPIPESRAVDIVVQFVDPRDAKLKFIGGIRSDSGQPCFVGGFQEQDAYKTAVREFIEESISGSIDLKTHAPRLYQLCKVRKDNESFSEDEKTYLKTFHIDPEHFTGDEGEAVYHFIAAQDPAFINALTDYFKTKLSVAYTGPCRADPRNTDHRWIATTLLTGIIDHNEINALLQGQKFPYKFAAGSDLTSVKLHEVGPDFVLNAFASHGALLCLATAHNLEHQSEIPDTLIQQCRSVIDTINHALTL